MRRDLRALGFDLSDSQTPIIPIQVGSEVQAAAFWKDLLDHGIYTNASITPAVPRGQALLRTSYIATHSDEQLDHALEIFAEIGHRHGII